MVLPREMAEFRLLYLNSKRNDKKFPKPFRLADIAPWALFHHERDAPDPIDEDDLANTIRSLVPTGDRIEIEDIRGESDGGDRISG